MGCAGSKSAPVSEIKSSGKNDNSKAESVNEVRQPEVVKEVTWKTIHSAVRWNKVDEAKKLIDSYPDLINSKDEKNGNGPIHVAAQNGHLEVVKYLILKKALINEQNNKGNTALHMAVGYDYYDVAKVLIAAGSELDTKNTSGFTAIQGLEGDKSMPLIALISAEKSKSTELAKESLKLCKENINLLEKASFAGAGLRAKKALGDQWTPEFQDTFKGILDKLD